MCTTAQTGATGTAIGVKTPLPAAYALLRPQRAMLTHCVLPCGLAPTLGLNWNSKLELIKALPAHSSQPRKMKFLKFHLLALFYANFGKNVEKRA